MGRFILAVLGLGLIAMIVNMMPIPPMFANVVYVILGICLIYLILVMCKLVPGPPWWGSGPPI